MAKNARLRLGENAEAPALFSLPSFSLEPTPPVSNAKNARLRLGVNAEEPVLEEPVLEEPVSEETALLAALGVTPAAVPNMSSEPKSILEKYPWAVEGAIPASPETPSVPVNTSPMLTPPTAATEAGSVLDPNANGSNLDSLDIASQDNLDPITGKNYAGSVRPKVQSFSDADQKVLIGNVMQQGLKVTPEMAILGGGMARDKSALSDKNFEKDPAPDMQREQAGMAKAEQDSGTMRAKAVDKTQLLAALDMVEKTPAVIGQKETIAGQETALKKLLKIEENIPMWSKLDMTMSLAFMDELYGTKLAKSYKPYQTPEGAIQKLNANILAEKGKLAAQRERMMGDLMKDKDTEKRASSIQGSREVTELPPGTTAAKIASANRPSGGPNPNDLGWARLGLAKEEAAWRQKQDEINNALAAENQLLKKEKDDTEATVKMEKTLKADKAVRVFKNIDQIIGKGKEMKDKYMRVPGTGFSGLVASTHSGLGEWYNKGENILGYANPKLGEYNSDKALYNSAKKELSAAILNYYSGASTTDKEMERYIEILTQETPADHNTYLTALQMFTDRFKQGSKLNYHIVKSDKRMNEALNKVEPETLSTFRRYVGDSPAQHTITPQPVGGTPTAPAATTPDGKPKKKVLTDEERRNKL